MSETLDTDDTELRASKDLEVLHRHQIPELKIWFIQTHLLLIQLPRRESARPRDLPFMTPSDSDRDDLVPQLPQMPSLKRPQDPSDSEEEQSETASEHVGSGSSGSVRDPPPLSRRSN